MATRVGIFSAALIHLERDPIADPDDMGNAHVRVLKPRYDTVRDALLRSYPWNFAKRFATLSGAALPAPAFGFSYASDLPAGSEPMPWCLRVWDVEASGKWKIVGRKLFSEAAPPISIDYVARVDENQFDPIFEELLALDLALAVFGRIPPENAIRRLNDLRGERKRLRRTAGLSDAMESAPDQIKGAPGSWLAARRPA